MISNVKNMNFSNKQFQTNNFKNELTYLNKYMLGKIQHYSEKDNYIITENYILYNTHLTAKELYSKLTLDYSMDYYAECHEKNKYIKQYTRIKKSIDDDCNIVKEQWLKKIAENDLDYLLASRLLGIEYDVYDNYAERLAKIKNAICEGVENHKNSKRLVNQAKNEILKMN